MVDDEERDSLEAAIDVLIYDFVGLGMSMPRAMELRKRILVIPEIADALKLVPVRNLGPSVSTGKRDPV